MHKFIVLEGCDGVGKTTLAKAYAQEHGALYIRTPGEEFASMRPYIDKHASPETSLYFYLSSVFDASRKIKEELETQDVICDRYTWSSLIPHSVYFDRDLSDLQKIVQPLKPDLLLPDTQVLVTVEETEQLSRLGLRQNNYSASDVNCLDNQKRQRLRKAYEHVAKRDSWEIIDTTNSSVSESVAELSNLVEGGIPYNGLQQV